jgi:hypothetical protein
LKTNVKRSLLCVTSVAAILVFCSCGTSDDSSQGSTGPGGTGGSSGTAGSGGTAGSSGASGTAGTSSAGGMGGAAGSEGAVGGGGGMTGSSGGAGGNMQNDAGPGGSGGTTVQEAGTDAPTCAPCQQGTIASCGADFDPQRTACPHPTCCDSTNHQWHCNCGQATCVWMSYCGG